MSNTRKKITRRSLEDPATPRPDDDSNMLITELRGEIERKDEQILNLTEELAGIARQKDDSMAENIRLNGEITQYTEEVATLKRDNDMLIADLARTATLLVEKETVLRDCLPTAKKVVESAKASAVAENTSVKRMLVCLPADCQPDNIVKRIVRNDCSTEVSTDLIGFVARECGKAATADVVVIIPDASALAESECDDLYRKYLQAFSLIRSKGPAVVCLTPLPTTAAVTKHHWYGFENCLATTDELEGYSYIQIPSFFGTTMDDIIDARTANALIKIINNFTLPEKSEPIEMPADISLLYDGEEKIARPAKLISSGVKPNVPAEGSRKNVLDRSASTSASAKKKQGLEEVLVLPHNAGGKIIGKEGQTIKEMEKETRTKITLKDAHHDGKKVKLAYIRGTKEGISKAKLAIDRCIKPRN